MSDSDTDSDADAGMQALALALDAQFLTPAGTRLQRRDGRRAIRAMVDCLEVVERCHEHLGDALAAAVFVLLRGVKDGTIDRVTCRARAWSLLRHVVHAIDPDDAVALIRLLGALAVVPDGDARMARALSPVPAPGHAVEEAIAAHLAGDGPAAAVRRALLAATIVVPVLDMGTEAGSITLRLLPLVGRDGPMVSVFSTAERFEEYRHAARIGAIATVEVEGWELSVLVPPGHGVVINPGSVLRCALRFD